MTLRADQIIRRLVSACYSSVVLERFGFLDCGYEQNSPTKVVLEIGDVRITIADVSIANFGGAIVSAPKERANVMVLGENLSGSLKTGVILNGFQSVGRIVDEIHRILEGE